MVVLAVWLLRLSESGIVGPSGFTAGALATRISPPRTARRLSASSAADWKRRVGSTSVARANHSSKPAGTGPKREGFSERPSEIFIASSASVWAMNGLLPVRHSQAMTARLHRSVCNVTVRAL